MSHPAPRRVFHEPTTRTAMDPTDLEAPRFQKEVLPEEARKVFTEAQRNARAGGRGSDDVEKAGWDAVELVFYYDPGTHAWRKK